MTWEGLFDPIWGAGEGGRVIPSCPRLQDFPCQLLDSGISLSHNALSGHVGELLSSSATGSPFTVSRRIVSLRNRTRSRSHT